ncbi:phosphonate ABC transporter ATP-binding protein [Convivina intestini]|uniref:Phosphonate transport system ATP-binding protein n=1 Tax=Convivina intestini TaxID=1505726 RepID=A0A2U1DF19_9LACO|nr:phosphonate ABC transporter ATP-binding protein [Convivina intestini]PVY86277.1 phosphonate transport system ATP-binding protein [Convivina intestini]CAH1851083.1 Phosphate-import ATP-binding protein PhnC [Convivina intestini]SDB82104.1 phosphonate transport system ATP-binding protein [Leuconostocaceae bacterium R-53105]
MTTNKGNIILSDVSKIYSNGTVGLEDINLTFNHGEFVMIVGLSGSGKSTLLRAINRLHDVSTGTILINGEDITNASGNKLHKLRRSVAMIFQNYNLVKTSSVYRNVMSGRVGYYPAWKSAFGIFTKEDKAMAVANLKRVNLLDKYYVKAKDLSGGQQQRVGIARAMMQEPSVILADEPVSGLDPKTTKLVMNDLKRLNEEDGITIVLNVHSIGLALKYASRIVGLKNGRIVYDKFIEDVDKRDFKEIYREAGDLSDNGEADDEPNNP